jgi:hypothetical protein
MVFADKRYQRHDKRDKLPRWITSQVFGLVAVGCVRAGRSGKAVLCLVAPR